MNASIVVAVTQGYTMASMEEFLGVTPPISTTGPSEKDLEVTKSLIETLRSMDQYESDGEAQKR